MIARLAPTVGPVRFPVHPRTAARLDAAGLDSLWTRPSVVLSGPFGYDELLEELRRAKVTVTDSGGIQEEAAYFGVPVVVLRRSTPRWEGVKAGSTVLAGLDTDDGRRARPGRGPVPEHRARAGAASPRWPAPTVPATPACRWPTLLADPGHRRAAGPGRTRLHPRPAAW